MDKIKCFVIEDDPIILNWLKGTLADFEDVHLCGYASNKQEAVDGIQMSQPELLLTDIELDDCTTFDVLEALDTSVEFGIIFISSFEHYALRAIKANAIDYITKPIDEKGLRHAIDLFSKNREQKVDQLKSLLSYLEKDKKQKRIAIPMNGYTELVNLDDVLYFEASTNYCYIHIKDVKPVLIAKTLKEFEKKLSNNNDFIRIHQSYMINSNHIKKIYKAKQPQVMMSNGETLSISKSRKMEFFERVLSE